MEKNSSVGANPWSHHQHHNHHHHHHHHHHHFQILHSCPLHSYMLQQNNHVPTCPLFTPFPFRQNPELISPAILPDDLNPQLTDPNGNFTDSRMMQDDGQDLEDEEDEPMFVLTDEWRDFFAKSEAKRRLAKKQAKKKAKSKNAGGNTPAASTDCKVKIESAVCPEVKSENEQ